MPSAEFPLIITSAAGRNPAAFDALAKLAETYALPVVQAEARDLNLASDHPMNFGFDVGPWLPKADVVVVLDSAVPWIPAHGAAEARRQDHPYLVRSAADEISVPRIRGGPARSPARSMPP